MYYFDYFYYTKAMNKSYLKNVSIVLCQTEGSANIGAVCRAMKTMNITTLKLVNHHPLKIDEIKKWSVHAFDVFENATIYTSLKDAVQNAVIVAGTSRRDGKQRKQFAMMSDEFANLASQYADGEIAIVFGNEKNGLDAEEINLCHHLVNIPTSDEYGSLNLSHAVQIICYELFKQEENFNRYLPINHRQVEILTNQIVSHLKAIGIFVISKKRGEADAISFWQSIFARSSLSKKESSYISTLFQRIEHIKTHLYLNDIDSDKLNSDKLNNKD